MKEFTIKIKNTGEEIKTTKKISGDEIYKNIKNKLQYPCYLMKVDNAYRALSHLCWHDCEVEFLDIKNQASWQTYQNSLVLLFNKAVTDVMGEDVSTSVQNSLNKGLFIVLNSPFDDEEIESIKSRMKELVKAKLPIIKNHMTKKKAIELARKLGHQETIDLLDTIEVVDDVQIYTLDNQTNFIYSQTVPSTEYLQYFDLWQYKKGLILSFPHPENPLELPPHTEQPVLYTAFKEATRWGKLLDASYVRDVNKAIDENNILDLVLLQEALHEKRIAQIAEEIKTKGKRVVLICGPSSSGKTTFAKRLCIQLNVAGLKTLYLGTDDYFKDEKDKPLDENGQLDLETINAVDTDLFIHDIKALLEGKTVDIPTFNFAENKKDFGKRITHIGKDEIIVIEGIHALNEKLTAGIEENTKYKIYISPFTPVGVDRHNRIPTTDARMLRRLVRDHQFRGRTPQKVLDEWINVRKSENVNIFPFHVEADTFFNSNCIYELAVLKKYAQPLLETIKREEPQYAEAQRMISFLKFMDPMVDDSIIPNNSIVREFIGGSVIVK